MSLFGSSWTLVRDKKLKQRQDSFNTLPRNVLSPLTNEEKSYLDADVSTIAGNIKSQKWSAENVIIASIKSCLLAHEATNCITEERFREALAEAKLRDDRVKELGNKAPEVLGPLWGVPTSVKDAFDITGLDTSVGMTSWCGDLKTEDAVLPKILQDSGAVVICKTNIPATMMTYECRNPIFGATTNPYSKQHTCGGSSGGEGAILALNGTLLGIGSDVGGSLRIPAHYCGIYSLKPSSGRFPKKGHANPNAGFISIPSVTGPMNRSMADLEIVTKVVLNSHPELYDYSVIPLPYDEEKTKLFQKLKFGYYLNDGYVRSSPPIQRAIKMVVKLLESAGHEVVLFDPPDMVEAAAIFSGVVTSDGFKTCLDNVSPDPVDSHLRLQTTAPYYPRIGAALATGVEYALGDAKFAKVARAASVKTAHELQKWNDRLSTLRTRWHELKMRTGIDAFITPPQCLPAIPNNSVSNISTTAIATSLFNMLDYTAGIVPVTTVDKSIDVLTSDWHAQLNGAKFGVLEKLIYQGKSPIYDPVKMHGLPVGVQIVGGRLEEEKVISIMKIIDDLLQK